jgi:hypothetical protein
MMPSAQSQRQQHLRRRNNLQHSSSFCHPGGELCSPLFLPLPDLRIPQPFEFLAVLLRRGIFGVSSFFLQFFLNFHDK